tara:strand:- start:1308 stop:2360 length:1053 start_codon:yes stop_codon:yes gene_type:complete
MKQKKILVTGGAGFIGSHTSLLLLEAGYKVIAIDSFINSSIKSINKIREFNSKNNIEGSFIFKEGDLRDENFLDEIFRKEKELGTPISSVIHFAGLKSVFDSIINPILYWEINLGGTISLLKIMKKYYCKSIVFSSSATIYDSLKNEKLNEQCKLKPINPYGMTKLTVERVLNNLFDSNSEEWRIATLRYFNPVGAHPSGILGEYPGDKPNNIFPIINKVANEEIKYFTIFGNDWDTRDGTCIRDYVHVLDLAKGHLLALDYLFKEKPQLLELNIGTGIGKSVLEVIETFESVNNVKIRYKFGNRRTGDVESSIAENLKAKTILNWQPKFTLEDMCRDAWNWQQMLQNDL